MGWDRPEYEVSGQGCRSLERPGAAPSFEEEDWETASETWASAAGGRVGERRAMSYAAVYRAVALISGAVAKLPLVTYRRVVSALGEGKERARDHPAFGLLRHKPCPEMTAFTFKQTLQAHALLHGNGYAYVRRRGNGQPLELLLLSPKLTEPVRREGRLWYVTRASGREFRLPHDDVLHVRGLGGDGLVGYSVLSVARESLGLGLAARRHEAVFFKNSARPGVVLEHPGKLTPEGKKNLRESWERMHAGVDNHFRTAVLEEGLKAHLLTMTARDAQLLETRQFEIREIANWFGVPPHMLGDTSRTSYSSLEQENQSFLDNGLDPWLCCWEAECWDKLLSEAEKAGEAVVIEFLRAAWVRANLSARGEFYVRMLQAGVLCANEVRGLENLNPIPGGDVFRVPLNMGQATKVEGGGDE